MSGTAAATFVEDAALRERLFAFDDRAHAGRMLADALERYRGGNGVVLAVPAGGVPVAAEIAQRLAWPLDLIVVRKVQVPYHTEAGFGAVDADGVVVLNEQFLASLGLSGDAVQAQIDKAKETVAKRDATFRAGRPFPPVEGMTVIIVDDGLASGYTMRAAVGFVKKRNPGRVIAAVPTGPLLTVQDLLRDVDEMVCLNVRSSRSFAVADAYHHWYDLSDDEVIDILTRGAAR